MSAVRAAIVACCLAILAAQVWEGPVATWSFGLSGTLLPVCLMALGAARSGRLGSRLKALLAGLALLLTAAMSAILLLADKGVPGPLGLPWATWFLLVGIGLLPLLVVGFGYAATFHRGGWSEEELSELAEQGRSGED